MGRRARRGMGAALAGVVLFLGGTAGAADGPKRMDPQPAAGTLEPGLAVDYYLEFYRSVTELIEQMRVYDFKPTPGTPLPSLDYNVGIENVLTSDAHDGVGAHIRGAILLDEVGDYRFNVRSNDGFRLFLGGEMLLEDPGVHAARFSSIGRVAVTEPGWYPLEMFYFERKNTATLELYWKKPGAKPDDKFTIVPPAAFAHPK